MTNQTNKKRGYIRTVLSCRCPRCREGNLFMYPLGLNPTKFMKMNEKCPVCGQPTEIEVGFYYGTSYVSYVITVLLSIITFLVWFFTIGMSVRDNRFFIWLISNAVLLIVLQPWLMRFSRSLWISWFVKYDPNWRNNKINPETTERIVAEHMSNW